MCSHILSLINFKIDLIFGYRVLKIRFLDFVKMVSRVEDMLDDVEIADEIQYSFVYAPNATISYINDI